MIKVRSLRGGVRIQGYDVSGNFVVHEFVKKGQTKDFKTVDPEILKQAVAVGWIHFSGKEEGLPKERAIENDQHNMVALQDAVSDALDASIVAREDLAEAKQRLNGISIPTADASEEVKAQAANLIKSKKAEIEVLEKAVLSAGEAYEKAKSELGKAK